MNKQRIAIYPGSFDPIHSGHIDIIKAGSKLFDKVIWAVGANSAKKPMFTVEQRMEMMNLVNKFPNIEIGQFDGLLVRYAEYLEAEYIIRSLRTSNDFEFEFQMTLVNKKLAPELTTIYLPAKQGNIHLSSTLIRELILNHELIDDCVPSEIRDFIRRVKEV